MGNTDRSSGSDSRAAPKRFATTRWSLVVAAAREHGGPESPVALATLCQIYWYPVYAYIRRRGYPAADAQDRTQAFFTALLEKDFVRLADRERGRFRTFLLTAVSRFLAKQRDRAAAKKRGGDRKLLSIDVTAGEGRYALEPSDRWTPERLYERRWALTLLDRVLANLGQRYAEQGKIALFDTLKAFLTDAERISSSAELAAKLGLTEGALKVAVHRLRRRYRDLLKQQIADTVADTGDVPDELEILLSALRGEV
jgi:DNA-directed RNA polymerase specialized sigma24 family protein